MSPDPLRCYRLQLLAADRIIRTLRHYGLIENIEDAHYIMYALNAARRAELTQKERHQVHASRQSSSAGDDATASTPAVGAARGRRSGSGASAPLGATAKCRKGTEKHADRTNKAQQSGGNGDEGSTGGDAPRREGGEKSRRSGTADLVTPEHDHGDNEVRWGTFRVHFFIFWWRQLGHGGAGVEKGVGWWWWGAAAYRFIRIFCPPLICRRGTNLGFSSRCRGHNYGTIFTVVPVKNRPSGRGVVRDQSSAHPATALQISPYSVSLRPAALPSKVRAKKRMEASKRRSATRPTGGGRHAAGVEGNATYQDSMRYDIRYAYP